MLRLMFEYKSIPTVLLVLFAAIALSGCDAGQSYTQPKPQAKVDCEIYSAGVLCGWGEVS